MTQTSFSTCRRGCRDYNPFMPFMPFMVSFDPHSGVMANEPWRYLMPYLSGQLECW
jgi:hypothetical protein